MSLMRASERMLAGTFVSYIATSPEKEETARAGLLREFAKLREAPVTAAELTRAQRYAIGTNAIRQESSATQLGDMLDAWAFGSRRELSEFDSKETTDNVKPLEAIGMSAWTVDGETHSLLRLTTED